MRSIAVCIHCPISSLARRFLGVLLTLLLWLLLLHVWWFVVGLGVETNPYAVLEIDLGPFNRNFPRLNMSQYIGQGVTFLNRHLSSSMFQVRHNHLTASYPLTSCPFLRLQAGFFARSCVLGCISSQPCMQHGVASSLLLCQC
jgi:hypothetical protein